MLATLDLYTEGKSSGESLDEQRKHLANRRRRGKNYEGQHTYCAQVGSDRANRDCRNWQTGLQNHARSLEHVHTGAPKKKR